MSRLVLVLAIVVLGCHDKPKPAAKPEGSAGSAGSAGSVGSAGSAAPPKTKLAGWDLPAGWRSEVIPFPLEFAPALAHRGYEELRFPPGFFDPASNEYWSYVFVWRTDDNAQLDALALGAELTTYFRGLIAAVDDKGRITARDQIVIRAEPAQPIGRMKLSGHVFDAFKTAQPLDLTGYAEKRFCGEGRGALWVFVLAPESTGIRDQLDALARDALPGDAGC